MGSTWLDMGPYSVRMKRTGSRKLSKCLPDLWDPIKIKKILKIPETPENPGESIYSTKHEARRLRAPLGDLDQPERSG